MLTDNNAVTIMEKKMRIFVMYNNMIFGSNFFHKMFVEL